MIYSTKKNNTYIILRIIFYYVTVVLFCLFFACLTRAEKSLAMQTGAITANNATQKTTTKKRH